MKLAEIDHKCEELNSARQQLEAKRAALQKLELEAKEKTREAQMLEEIAKLRGEEYEGEHELEELKKVRMDIKDCEKRIEKLEQEIFEGLKDVTFPIPLELPKIDSNGRSIISFEGPSSNYAVKFIASALSSDTPLELDRTELHSDKIIVTNVKEPVQVVDRLKVLHNNINRLARIALEEEDRDVEEVADYLHGSDYRQFWEIIKGRKKITYDDLASELGVKTSKERHRVRNFFTNLEQQLKDKFPFIRILPGVYELSFFGSLVWKRYCDKYPPEKEITKEVPREIAVGETVRKEEKPEASTLNKYLSNNEIKEVIYGKEVS